MIGCSKAPGPALVGIPDSIFEEEEEHTDKIVSVGHLTEAYVSNTTALRSANNKLSTLCVAAMRCKDEQEDGRSN